MNRSGFRSRRHPFVYQNQAHTPLSLCQTKNVDDLCYVRYGEQAGQLCGQRSDGSALATGMTNGSEVLAREPTVIAAKKRVRPKSYAEPRKNEVSLFVRNTFSCDGVQETYNGVSICDLEARLKIVRQQQLAKRRSISNFAMISCLEPNPISYLVEDEQGGGQDRLGIYIKSVVKGGSADKDGRLAAGDKLLSVDGQSLVGITQERAAEYLVRTGPIVTLEVAKEAAIYEGLATMLSQPSPLLSRGGLTAPRRLSERDLPSKVLREQNQDLTEPGFQYGHPLHQSRIQASKSVPSLNSDSSVGAGIQMGNGQMNTIVDAPRAMDSTATARYQRQYPPVNSMTMPLHREASQQPAGALRSRSIQSLTDPVHRPDIGSKQPSTPALYLHPEEDRFYQNLAYYASPPAPVNPANMPVRTYIPSSYSTGNIPSNQSAAFRNPQHPNPGRGPVPNVNTPGMGNPNGISQQMFQQQWQRSQQLHPTHPAQINQNLLRQEAKMLEMQDELRRREERASLMMHKAQQGYPDRGPRFSMPPSRYQPPQTSRMGPPPAAAPKPYRPGIDDQPPGRPPLPAEYRHVAEEPSRLSHTFMNKNPLNPNSPWEREEKERELQRRIEASKYWRDQQIHELELLGPNRNSQQDEQLKSLKMEREFQRRAEELNKRDEEYEGADGDPDEDEEDERKAMVKRIQEDLERTRLNNTGGTNGIAKEDERARKLEEIRRKKIELEATQAAEERLVREAQKRREQEELKRQSQLSHHQQPITSYQQYRSSYPPKLASPTAPKVAEAPPLPNSPPPALYRQCSQGSMSPQKSPVSPPQSSPVRPKSDKKSVSFNETVDTNEPSSPSPIETERVREDPNLFLSEATAMLSSPRSPDAASGAGSGNTPGVIGAQEVYRDPRWRRLEEQQQQKQATPKPEKLTFKEKMKMFAMESGEANTPKDKVKTSRAQREIEIPGSGPPANNNNESD